MPTVVHKNYCRLGMPCWTRLRDQLVRLEADHARLGHQNMKEPDPKDAKVNFVGGLLALISLRKS